MLARGTHQSLSIPTAGRANKRRLVVQHLFHRELSGFIVHKANAGTIKRLETKIRNVNASSHSAEFKYRNSVRFFAMIDQAKDCMELESAARQGGRVPRTDSEIFLDRTARGAKIRRKGVRPLLRGSERNCSS
jgi:hypothetical protein